MGILNITPDSFSDGGTYYDAAMAVEHAISMVENGADIIDVGGESTRPGSDPVSLDEELRRVIPVIRSLAGELEVPISIDTYKSEVAREAIDAGASIVNDISGLRFDSEMANVVAEHQIPVVIMHIKGTPKNMQKDPIYGNLIDEIRVYLKESINIATEAGVHEDKIIVDPGIGFGKTYEDNLEIIKRLDELKDIGRPILIGPSRKAFIGRILGDLPFSERIEGTAAAIAVSIINGANIVRVHDVKEMSRVTRVADAIKSGIIV
ncbi:MAG: dihydropteroate synthase [Nitrospirota bacterium]|nr:MAG: dihydropteroate synthase [Nitrospirota bacterium]